ncbi:MAG: hypothetical protein U1E73_09475 [Planctomycetota bacterium]
MTSEPAECRALLQRLRSGDDIAEPAFLHNSLALSDYAIVFMRSAQELMAKSGLPDFALPGGFYMMRHGLELWLKCILVSRNMDRLLRRIVDSNDTFETLAADTSWMAVKSKRLRSEVGESLKDALCTMRNVLVDGVVFPECRHVRQGNCDANAALAFLRSNRDTPRDRVAVLWMPPLEGHRLMELWDEAEPYVSDLRSGAEDEAESAGGGPVMTMDGLRAVYTLFNHRDQRGDALRYPASLGGKWHLFSPRWSLRETSALAGELAETIQLYKEHRSMVYRFATVGDPDGPLYLGGR